MIKLKGKLFNVIDKLDGGVGWNSTLRVKPPRRYSNWSVAGPFLKDESIN